MPNEAPVLDRVFHALSHPTRRGAIERLGRGPTAMTELARSSNMALPSFLQHMQVLESCQLVGSTKIGRVRVYQLEPAPLMLAERWMDSHRRQWETRLDQLDKFLSQLKEKP